MKTDGKHTTLGVLVTAVALLILTACPGDTVNPDQGDSPEPGATLEGTGVPSETKDPAESGQKAGDSSDKSVDEGASRADGSDAAPVPASDDQSPVNSDTLPSAGAERPSQPDIGPARTTDPSTGTSREPTPSPAPTKTSSVEGRVPAPGGPIAVPLPNITNARPSSSTSSSR